MNNVTHTPGPWSILQWADKRKGFIAVVVEPARHHICDVFPFGQRAVGRELAEHEANARLIAAAPELLALLKEIVSPDNESLVWFTPTDAYAIELKERVTATIAKAEGRSV